MPYARHNTYFLRQGWIRKALMHTSNHPEGLKFFQAEEAPEILGISRSMLKSLRFWLLALNLASETPDEKGKSCLTNFGKLVLGHDPYLEEEATLWLLHYHLCSNPRYATTWHWFFHIFNHKEFTKESFLYHLENHALVSGDNIAAGSLEKDYHCFVRSYQSNAPGKSVDPEDASCPFRELGLLHKSKNIYTKETQWKVKSNPRNIPSPDVFFFAFLDQLEQGNIQKTITSAMERPGKLFALEREAVLSVLDQLASQKCIRLKRIAGLDEIIILDNDVTSKDLLENIFRQKQALKGA